MPKPKVLVIVGSTASGKSALAVQLAGQFNGEVISADSRQVYRGLDIGSGKLGMRERKGVRHHLLDVANPKRTFSVAQFQKRANQALQDIAERGKLPIICGGTGFYIQALVDDLVLPPVKTNSKLRKSLEKLTTEELFKRLHKLDPKRATNIDSKNPRRLVRAIEIATALGQVPIAKEAPCQYDFLQIGLRVPEEILREKINKRLARWLKQGLMAEVKKLRRQKISFKRIKEFGLEYFYLAEFLEGKISKEKMIEKSQTAIYQYAKRQLTWFKRDKRINWILAKKSAIVDALGLIVQWQNDGLQNR